MKLQSRSREEPEINVISLVDVLLVLVLFFMVSTSFLRETEISLTLPEANTEARIAKPDDALEITITQSGTYLVNGRELVNNERRTLRAAISRLMGEKRDLPVFIRADAAATHQAVVTAMDIMQNDLAYMLSKYRVTLSTSGVVPNIYRLKDVSDVSLAVSLHAPDNALRDLLVPINRKYPLETLLPACKSFIQGDKRRRVTWEYVMIDGVNDSITHAKQLVRLLEGIRSKLNLIPFNPFPGSDFRTSPPERIEAFRQRILRSGIVATTRKTRGDEIAAACGQLVGRVRDRSRRVARHQTAVRVAAP